MDRENLYLNKKGFFLIEAGVAVAICSVTILTVTTMVSVKAHLAEILEDYPKHLDQDIERAYALKKEIELCEEE